MTALKTSFRSLVVALILATCLVAVTTGPAVAAIDSGAESEFAKLINYERQQRGLKALTVVGELRTVARDHSVVMANKNHLHHNPDLSTDVTNWLRLAENVGVGPSVSSLHKALMESTGHRANILDSKVTELGVGVEVRDGRIWVTQIFRLPENATLSSTSSPASLPAGRKVRALSGDWDGNGTVTPGWFIDGGFYLSNRHNGSGTLISFSYGRASDTPVVGDWNGDGKDTVGVVRDRKWYLINKHRSGTAAITLAYGSPKDIPLSGDWNADGKDTPGIVRDGAWHLINHFRGGNSQIQFKYGRVLQGDIPLVGDWNRDGRDTAGIIRDGTWHLINKHRSGSSDVSFNYGRVSQGDVPVVGDWDGDRDTNVAVIRDRTWYYRLANTGGPADYAYTWAP